MKVVIRQSSKRNKKFAADDNGRTLRFGDPKYEDLTQHKYVDRKKCYIQRHRKNENWNNDLRSTSPSLSPNGKKMRCPKIGEGEKIFVSVRKINV